MKRSIVTVFMLLLIPAIVNAFSFDFEEQGIRLFYGNSQLSLIGSSSEDNQECKWVSVNYLFDKEINNWLIFQNSVGIDYFFSDHESSPAITGRIAFDLHKKYLYFNLNGGVAYLFNHGDLPDLANSLLYGLVGMEVGIKILDNDTTKLKVAYFTNHISSPFHSKDDPGWNVGGIAVQVIIKF